MSGYPYGNPQYPPPHGQIYPQLNNPANAPPPGQPGQPAPAGYPSGATPQFPYQPGFAGYPLPQVQPQHGFPAAMSYPNVTPSAPLNVQPTGPGYGYPGYPVVSPTTVAPVEWVLSNAHTAATLSDRAVVAGYEGHDGSPLWVIRSHYEGDVIPGKLAIKHRSAYIPWGGNENSVANFEVCCVSRPETVRWLESRDGSVPPNAIPAGRTSSGETLYVGRAKQQGSLTPGKVHPSHKCLYISFAGQEHSHRIYEVLCTA